MFLLLSCVSADLKAIRQDDQEQTLLQESARLYWEGVRWEVPEQSVTFIAEDDQALFQARIADQRKEERITEALILKATLEEVPPETTASSDVWRTGTVLVRLEGYTLPAQILLTEELTQSWYRTPSGWVLDWDPEAPGPLTGLVE